MSGKRYNNKKKGKSINILTLLFITFFIVLMVFSGIKIVKWIKENMQNKNISREILKRASIDESADGKYSIDFEYLQQANPDTVAWIKVKGTDIEYPVLKTSNNEFYLVHNFDKK